jgi:alkaline phosphatase D
MALPMDRRGFLALASALLGGCAAGAIQRQPNDAGPQGALRRISFASCIDQTKPQPIWDTIIAGRPDVFIFAGDNVYAEAPYTLQGLQRAYALAAESPGMSLLRQGTPHIAIWDDHDYGLNDGGTEFRFKAESKAEFLQFWRVPREDERRTRDGLYYARIFGPPGQRVQVILLDTRWFRSRLKVTDQRNAPGRERYVPDPDPRKTMLGEAQWAWLDAQLREPADVRLVVSGIQVVVDGHGFERWGNLPLERERLYRLIAQTRANGVVFLSGDRHVGGLYRETAGTPYPLFEITSSGITHTWRDAPEPGPNRLGALFTDLHYGDIDIDWSARALELSIHDIVGKAQRKQRIAFDELKAQP